MRGGVFSVWKIDGGRLAQTHRNEFEERVGRLRRDGVLRQGVACKLLYEGMLFVDRNGHENLSAADIELGQVWTAGKSESGS